MGSELTKVKAADGSIAVFDYGDDRGAGFEKTGSDDMSLPYLSVLQALSPEVSGEPGDRVAGASAGRLMNTVTKELYPETGIIFQPCAETHMFVEWKPRQQGGGFVGVHDQHSDVVTKAKAASKDFGKYKTDAGNDLVETIYMVGLIHRDVDLEKQLENGVGEPIIITFQSTKIRAVKNLNYRLYTLAGKPPLFAHRIAITTVQEKNPKGTFYNFVLKGAVGDDLSLSLIPPKLGDTTHPLLIAGRDFKKAHDNGGLKINYGKQDGAGAGAGQKEDDIPF